MRAKRSWWQQIKHHPFIVTGIIVALLVLIVFIFSAYRFGWSGTGFLNKSLWDWLQLLIIPLALAVIALVFQRTNTRTERQIAKERYEQDQQIALDKQHEDLLQAYLDRIAELLLKENLRTSPSEEVRNVARVRTITVLTQLGGRRVGHVFTFLREAGLMLTTSDSSVVNLKDADLIAVKWRYAFLQEANLSGAFLNTANLSGAFLRSANLSDAFINHANLSRAILYQATLSDANLSGANLSNAILFNADFSNAILEGVNLNKAWVTEEQLKQAKSLKGATMPDGSKHP